jgi:TonB family protein
MLRRIGLFLFFLFTVVATAQPSKVLNDAVARKNLIKSPAPLYPDAARAAKVNGDVVLQAQIGEDGRVQSARVLSGPAVLRGAAIDAVAQWQFKPFLQNGVAVSVKAKLVVPFATEAIAHAPEAAPAPVATPAPVVSKAPPPADDADQKTAKVFFALSDKCHALVGARAATAEQAKACKAAALEADKFASNSRHIERRAAYVYCATALMRNHNLDEAVIYGGKAVGVVEQGHDDGSGSSAAYAVRGQAEALTGDLARADADLTKAEDFERSTLSTPVTQPGHANSKAALRSLLSFHADVLKAMGKDAEAAGHLKEADALKP